VRAVAATGAEVLVTGPPGAGVSKVAEVVHLLSNQSGGPFVKRAAAEVTPDSLDTLLGTAAGGSLFLDEIASMPAPGQYALLERIEQGIDARLIAGTTADPAMSVADGGFNSELYYRLDVMPVRIPPLSERPEDIPVLFRHYVAQAAEQAGIEMPEISPDHLASLMAQDWPGNARSLMSAAMRFVLGMPEEASEAAELGLGEQMARVERSLLIAALSRQNGNATATAKTLKLPRKTFYDKLARYEIRPEDYRR
jgi:two-component system C4-dicarboxylate transport response regulator DctD